MMKYFTHTNAGKLKLNFRAKMNVVLSVSRAFKKEFR